MRRTFGALLASLILAAGVSSAGEVAKADQIIEAYLDASRRPNGSHQDSVVDVRIEASVPRLHKRGTMHATKIVSAIGQTTYRALRFEGDEMIRSGVIARYLAADRQAADDRSRSRAITPQNYRFRLKGIADYAGEPAYVFELEPRRKDVGLFRGELWIDARTFLPLRQWGELAKSPSMLVRSVYFVRDYFIQDGRAVLVRLITSVDTRVAGRAELTVWFSLPAQQATGTELARAASPAH